MEQGPLYWLLNVEAYDYDIGVLRGTDLKGNVLILSRQLWSVIRGDTVISILIGPGVFKGAATSGNRRVEITEPLSALMFDPTHMRADEPVPLVDIISPEVIDPLASRKTEEIMTTIRQLVVERGNVLAAEPLMKVSADGTVPTTAYTLDLLKKIHVAHVSGTQRAKFILAGTNSPLYRPMVNWYNKHRYDDPLRTKVMATPFNKFTSIVDIDIMSDWTVVEKAGMDGSSGIEAIRSEYEETLDAVRNNESQFIYEV
jgi:hypothetical protein